MKSFKFKYLSITKVLYIHDQAVKQFGGSHGVRDIGLVESAVARPSASFDDNDLYETVFDKAAALLQSLLKNHPFVDGNKRTAIISGGLFLRINGWKLINNHKIEVKFGVQVDNKNLTLEQISKWLKDHSQKVE